MAVMEGAPERSLGIDLGTGSVKLAVIDAAGQLLGSTTREYPVSLAGDRAEIEPDAWWRAIVDGIDELVATLGPVQAIGLDGQLHATVPLDDSGAVVRPAILWPDHRAESVLGPWRTAPESVRRGLANPIAPGMPGPVLEWLAVNEPESCWRIAKVVAAKDWIRGRLTGEPWLGTDPSDASATLMWHQGESRWFTEWLEQRGIPADWLPEVTPADAVGGTCRLPQLGEVPVSVGCGDVAATLVGSGSYRDSELLVVGSGIQYVQEGIAETGELPPSRHTYCGADGRPYGMSAILNGGVALGRMRTLMNATWDELNAQARLAPELVAGAPVVVPLATAERFGPLVDGRFVMHGPMNPGREQVLYAMLEGVCFIVRSVMEAAFGSQADRPPLVTLGGGAQTGFEHLMARVLRRDLLCGDDPYVTVRGAALLGFRAAGIAAAGSPDPRLGRVAASGSELVEARYQRFLDLVHP